MTRHRPGGPIPVPQQIATDPDRVMRRLAVLVAAELRRTGQAVLVPVHRQTLRDRLTPLSAAGALFAGGLAAVLVVAALALIVWQVT